MAFTITLSILIFLGLFVVVFFSSPRFGKKPKGESLAKLQVSPNFVGSRFVNQSPRLTKDQKKKDSEKNIFLQFWKFAMAKPSYLKPSTTLPSIKTDLMSLDLDIDVLVWLGHSTLYMQLGGCRFLIDPVLISGSPVPFINKAFKGSDIYIPNDIPKIDYLLVTHDHFDHLDYKSVKSLKDKIGKVVCGLGVGEHFKRWKFDGSTIIELDWSDRIVLKNGSELFACPARHYSGRSSFGSDLALWVSFVIKIGGYTLFISGDSGYDKHFGEISKQFGAIDLAIIENGQYGHGWRDIHIMPDELLLAVEEIGAKKLFTVHNSKFALAQHGWIEPLDNIYKADKENGYGLMTPMIGEVVRLKDETQVFNNWWKTID